MAAYTWVDHTFDVVVVGAGGLRDEAEAYKAFRGRMPDVEGLLKKRGLAGA